jgi:hypothetical protein
MAMGQPDLDEPPTIIRLPHQDGMPVIKIAHQVNGFCPARGAAEIDLLDGIARGIDSIAGFFLHGIQKKRFFIDAFLPFLVRFR